MLNTVNSSVLRELALLFLKLGTIGFGGPVAHIALMHGEVVKKRKWLTEQQFLDLMGATNLIPGPNSTEMAIHIGQERAGWRGLIIAGLCFILPAVCITGVFAWFYKRYGQLPEVQPFVYGVKPAIIAVMLGAVYPLARKSVRTWELAGIGMMVLIGSLLSMNEVVLLFGAGLIAVTFYEIRNAGVGIGRNGLLLLQLIAPGDGSLTNTKLFLIFLKIGAILYGSGYVLFAFLDTELVARGWLSRAQLVDAIAVGQFTPGPVFSAVTFVGYQINGLSGAVLGTIAIFLPAFVFVAVLNPLVKHMRNSTRFALFLDAVNVASVAIILSVCWSMGVESIVDWRTVTIGVLSLIVAFGFSRINSAWVVLGGAILGFVLMQLG
jgi:chromate transporter